MTPVTFLSRGPSDCYFPASACWLRAGFVNLREPHQAGVIQIAPLFNLS